MKATVKVLVLLGAPILFATKLPTSSQAAAMPQPAAVAAPGTHGSVQHHTVRHRRHKGRAGVRHHSRHKRLG
jgi:hypothetical protein